MIQDWGEASEAFDDVREYCENKNLTLASEAETRFKVIDRVIREVLGWNYSQIVVEEKTVEQEGYVDYILRDGDNTVIVEAKKYGAAFPTTTNKKTLKFTGSILGTGDVKAALDQAHVYAIEKNADVVIITNGRCWIFYPVKSRTSDARAHLLFPFDRPGQAEELFNYFALPKVTTGSLNSITEATPIIENRLLSVVRNADHRVDRNAIANSIAPAINAALLADSLLENLDTLERCYVTTDARIKFDSMLNMYLADPKPYTVEPAKKLKPGKKNNELEKIVSEAISTSAPPVTLLIGSVGSGKSTFLKHFELVSGREVLANRKIHWIYIDLEKMGRKGNVREFLYQELLQYIETDRPENPISYNHTIYPAYKDKIEGLTRTRLAGLDPRSIKYKDAVYKEIEKDYDKVQPYVDRILKFIASHNVCVIILDNVDLYEDAQLETYVFAEGLALSKRVLCNVIVSLRDTTYVKHQSDATFDAYQLQKLWLNPPDFKEVVSNRLTYGKLMLKDKPSNIRLANNMTLHVDDLSVFFDIVQRSILGQEAGDFIAAIADLNIRKGLNYINNFLTSGHINADIAVRNYLHGENKYIFPFHEVFKGAMLSQWRYFQEAKSPDCVNLFDSRLGSRKLQLLRFHIVKYLTTRAQAEQTLEVNVQECIELFSSLGVSEKRIIDTLSFLQRQRLIRTNSAETVSATGTISATRCGGYYVQVLSHKFVYIESVMYDTAIADSELWLKISELTQIIETHSDMYERMKYRRTRIEHFLEYLTNQEDEYIPPTSGLAFLRTMSQLCKNVHADVDDAVRRTRNSQKR